jgi:hypothetical protein
VLGQGHGTQTRVGPNANVTLTSGYTYNTTGAFASTATSYEPAKIKSSVATSAANLNPASVGSVPYVSATDITSNILVTVNKGILVRTVNWSTQRAMLTGTVIFNGNVRL